MAKTHRAIASLDEVNQAFGAVAASPLAAICRIQRGCAKLSSVINVNASSKCDGGIEARARRKMSSQNQASRGVLAAWRQNHQMLN